VYAGFQAQSSERQLDMSAIWSQVNSVPWQVDVDVHVQ
jgi:hypothetical protein